MHKLKNLSKIKKTSLLRQEKSCGKINFTSSSFHSQFLKKNIKINSKINFINSKLNPTNQIRFASKDKKIDLSSYTYKPPLIPPRFRYRREEKKRFAKTLLEFEDWGKLTARTLEIVERNEGRDRLKNTLENKIFKSEYKRMQKTPIREAKRKAYELYRKHQNDLQMEIEQRRMVMQEEKERAKQEWIRSLLELNHKWTNSPNELFYTPYRFHPTFDPSTTKIELFRRLGRSPRVKGTIGQSPVKGQPTW